MPNQTLLANAIRFLAMDAVQQANSGHPGAPMGMADIAQVLFNKHMRHNPKNPKWFNRDRFVMSNGHGSMLVYAVLHLSGYDLSMAELKNFRQLHSKTPGHPEYGYTAGVETTTGPLGQGLANAVGMALAEKMLAAQFNRDNHTIIDHFSYVFLGDGCLMEGISHEVCSLAGTLGLGKLIALYDDNNISIDGPVDGWFTDNTPQRFKAYGWHVVEAVDGHDPAAVHAALKEAKNNTDQPTLICCKTTIGSGAPNKAGSHETHGAPLGDEEIALTRKALNWSYEPFEIPDEIYQGWNAEKRGAQQEQTWQQSFDSYKKAYPELAADLSRRINNELPADFDAKMNAYLRTVNKDAPKIATRIASKLALEGLGPLLPELFGGSADLTPSNNTFWSGSKHINGGDFTGNYLSFGVREFGMSAITTGMSLHGGIIPYTGTFLMFSDYAKNALRMAALMKVRNIFVYTHDSIGVGEDGPTHQPVEQLPALRMIPNMHVWRPCDAVESVAAWHAAIKRTDGPTSLLFTRQGVPHQPRNEAQLDLIAKGGYILNDCNQAPELIIMATGSEVGIAAEATAELQAKGHQVRLVSIPCVEVFLQQTAEYQSSVLPRSCRARLAVEAAKGEYWYRFVGIDGAVVAQDTFGESAPGNDLFEYFNITTEAVLKRAKALLNT